MSAIQKAKPRVIELKTDPDAYDATARGDKAFEIRFNDRDYQVGDILHLKRTKYTGAQMRQLGKPLEYTGEELAVKVTHVQCGYGISDNWVGLSHTRPGAIFRDNGADIEKRMEEHADISCPACGGSGHKDDFKPVQSMQPESVPLDERMKAAGMMSVSDMLENNALGKYSAHAGVNSLEAFDSWLKLKHEEFIRLHARIELDKETDGDLYEWVIAHAAVLGSVRANFRQALQSLEGEAITFDQFIAKTGLCESGYGASVKQYVPVEDLLSFFSENKLYTTPQPPAEQRKELAGDFQTTRLMAAKEMIKDGNYDHALMHIDRAIKCAQEQPPAVPDGYDYYSNDDGDTWLESPSDIEFVNGLTVGDEYELLAAQNSVSVKFRVTKTPDESSDDYEVERVDAMLAAAQQGGGDS